MTGEEALKNLITATVCAIEEGLTSYEWDLKLEESMAIARQMIEEFDPND